MALLKTKRTFVGSRAVRTLGALTLGAGMTLGGLSLAWAGDEVPGPDEVRALGYNTLTFQDEFNGSELDTSKWGLALGCFDPNAHSQAQYSDAKENVSVSGGVLHLTARYEPKTQKWDRNTHSMVTVDRECKRTSNGQTDSYKAPFTSAMVQTRDNKGVKWAAYGDFYAEARIKLPTAVASWPAFWMTGTDPISFPAHGEIDVVEAKGWDPHYLQANVHTPRVGNPQKTEQHQGQLGGDGSSQSQFHTYGVEKNGRAITFYLDGRKAHTVTYDKVKGSNPFVNDANGMILRLNQMVGGTFLASDKGDTTYTDATKYIDAYKGNGSDMLVDYVRVWKKGPATRTVPEPTPTTSAPEVTTPTPEATTPAPSPVTPSATTQTPVAPTPEAPVVAPKPVVPSATTEAPVAPTAQPTVVAPQPVAPTASTPDPVATTPVPNTNVVAPQPVAPPATTEAPKPTADSNTNSRRRVRRSTETEPSPVTTETTSAVSIPSNDESSSPSVSESSAPTDSSSQISEDPQDQVRDRAPEAESVGSALTVGDAAPAASSAQTSEQKPAIVPALAQTGGSFWSLILAGALAVGGVAMIASRRRVKE